MTSAPTLPRESTVYQRHRHEFVRAPMSGRTGSTAFGVRFISVRIDCWLALGCVGLRAVASDRTEATFGSGTAEPSTRRPARSPIPARRGFF